MPKHAEKKVLPHTPEQMYALVADIEKYPDFLPWCVATRIKKREDEGPTLIADMVIGFKMVREKFTSHVVLTEPRQIDVKYFDGPFKYLENKWIFDPHGDGECLVDFYVDFEFRSRLLEKIMGPLFEKAVHRMITAFESRADELYGSSA
ncbi:MAG: type II toxin-antitoxin system RatA family toxin [Rhodospirillaceae bacterium]|jgi:coenzyme Q-binding protein COQ10|nr:type II toxin-antitoxin system RatA family toxin [Rhodospirillales bacterium]MBT3907374.1 type II toxin-antitoxin system RatA family toxin [Rhodospirillaceae bacterium]MBT4701679.1 type II toxin-antitoxin system RatA family toxin [Rhodospirillaceae bacterium]MBT5035042.1 type II toxin-antitoxin system RatA family toxin [Rhodospirillaceae bacterium]MBT6221819.1 type II toxin-antitoxin system RatA family toxin [Rhodospirillaceae bacterium]